jgi:hypothetical protein
MDPKGDNWVMVDIDGDGDADIAIQKESSCGCCNEDPCGCADDCECKMNESVEEELDEAGCNSKKMKKEEQELDEEPNEGNEFTHELKKAKDAGEDEFEVDGKKYKVKESEEVDEEEVVEEEVVEELEEISEAPTMDTTQLIHLLKLSGISEDQINEHIEKLSEQWANTPEGVGEKEPTVHGDEDNYNFAQAVNLSLKRYLDAQDMKVSVNEGHTIESMKAKYEAMKESNVKPGWEMPSGGNVITDKEGRRYHGYAKGSDPEQIRKNTASALKKAFQGGGTNTAMAFDKPKKDDRKVQGFSNTDRLKNF